MNGSQLSAMEQTPGGAKTILVVEDERVVAKDLQRTLEALGYRVPATAATSEEARRLAEQHRPDLVLMDIRIEGSPDGIETATLLRARLGVPVVFLTAYADVETLERAKVAEPDGYLLKPVKSDALRSTIEIALHGHALQRRLRERERWLSTVLRSIADAVISTDRDGRIDGMNLAAEKLCGRPAAEAIGRPIAEVVELREPGLHGALLRPVEDALEQRRRVRIDAARLGGVDSATIVADSAAPILDENGEVAGAVLVLSDVTEPLRLRRQLEFTDRLAALGTLAAGVAHEINNPLAFILANLHFARRTLQKKRAALADVPWILQLRDALGDAEAGGERVKKIVADLRRFAVAPAQSDAGGGADLRGVLEWAAEITRGELAARARLALDVGDLPPVRGDETRLGQVFVNLLVNAAHAIAPGTPGKNRISIRAQRDADDRVLVEVSDTGAGMPEEVAARIFEPFFTTKPVGKGSGLGLSIVHGIVTSLGGDIQVDSRPGAGTVVRVRLPVASGLAPVAPAAEPERITARGCDVLLIDDERLLRVAVRRFLEENGHTVSEAESADDALALIEAGCRFDVLLCDLMMPGRTGMELYRELEARLPDQARRTVFMTGGSSLEGAVEFLASVPNQRLDKPFGPEQLQRMIGDQVEKLGRVRREPRE